MIRNATMKDLDSIMVIVNQAKAIMQQDNNPQWNDKYPLQQHFVGDIENKSLYVLDENNTVYGFVAVDQSQAEWYDSLKWPINKNQAFVIHRLANSPNYKGGATKLFAFALNLAKSHEVDYVLTDTFALNYRAQQLFTKFGFTKVGEATMDYFPFDKGKPFYAYYTKLKK